MDLAWGTILHGWALAEQGQREEGIAQLQQGLAAHRAMGAGWYRSYSLTVLAEAYGRSGQVDKGLATITEALQLVKKNDEHFYEAEAWRMKGDLLLAQAGVRLQAEG